MVRITFAVKECLVACVALHLHLRHHRRSMLRSASIIISAAACSCSAFSTHLIWRSMPRSSSRPLETRRSFPPLAAHLPDAPTNSTFDIVLSSGQCSFAAHCGFLEAVELAFPRNSVGTVLGTSSGALIGEPAMPRNNGEREAMVRSVVCRLVVPLSRTPEHGTCSQ